VTCSIILLEQSIEISLDLKQLKIANKEGGDQAAVGEDIKEELEMKDHQIKSLERGI
jgi:hypothetical protein